MKTPADVDFVRESIITFLWDSLDKIVAFIAFVYFANYFTTTSFGAAYTVIGISMMASSVPNSVAIAIQKRVSEDTADHERFFIFGIILLITYALFVGGLAMGAGAVTTSQFEYLTLAGITHLVGRPFLFHVERLFDGVGFPGAAAGLDFADGLLTAALRFLFILGFGMGAEGLLYSAAVSGLVIGLAAYFGRFGIPRQQPSTTAFQDIKEFSSFTLLSRVSSQVFQNSAVVLTGTLISPTFASYIKSAKNLIEPARIPVRSVIKSIFVKVSAGTERGDLSTQPIQNGIDVASVFAIPLAIGAVVIGDEVMVTIYGTGYAASGYVLVAVSFAFVFDAFTKIAFSTLNGSNNPDLAAHSSVLTMILSIPVFTITILLGGDVAFLVVLVISYAFRLGLFLRNIGETLTPLSALSWRFVVDQFLAAICMGALVALLTRRVAITSWIDLIAVVGFGVICYGLVLLVISAQGRQIAETVFEKFQAT